MILPSNLFGILFALTSAAVWGSGDFSGGYATRKASPFQVLALSALSGIVILVACALVWREALPSAQSAVWALLGGAAGAVGIAALYRALSMGHTASVAPTSGVIGAALPVVFGMLTHGLPPWTRAAGFVLAFAGIWMVASSAAEAGRVSRQAFLLACLAGVGFGGFFILIGLVEPGKIFIPLVIARSMTFATGLILIAINRLPLPGFRAHPVALLAGLLDAGGNVFYVLAKQFTQVEVAAVLSSFYPASTVVLASLLLKEKITRIQWTGVVFCLAAIVLITV